jgi:tRNA nucleotidyltransferase (CCA-adding enzyme)
MEALAPRMELLAKERIFDELCKLLPLVCARDLQRFAPILTAVIPELAPTLGFDQHSHHHTYDIFTHTAHVVEGVPADLPLRWAALLHDIGKVPTFTMDEVGQGHFYGHAEKSAEMADAILHRLKAPTQLREDVVFLIEKHMTPLIPEPKLVRRRLSQYGERRLRMLLALQNCDFCAKGVTGDTAVFAAIDKLMQDILDRQACLTVKDLAVNGHDLMALGYTGRAIGQALQFLLEQVLDDRLPNEKDALINALKK